MEILWQYLELGLIEAPCSKLQGMRSLLQFKIIGETVSVRTECLMGYLKLYLDALVISPFVLYGEESFPQAFTPGPHIFLKG
ncbi:MAG: hypothetical protein JSV01_07395 [Desulfobacterales bacterium]|nr:MAG: hypothetical protein JSV01_07395 [Desulfobacterales bacterium]UCG80353.1 MAG: hypothetical protein JSV60_10395 [Desulfobacterales bacterium]